MIVTVGVKTDSQLTNEDPVCRPSAVVQQLHTDKLNVFHFGPGNGSPSATNVVVVVVLVDIRFSFKSLRLSRLKIERKLLLTAYIKSCTGFRLPSKYMTLNDLETRFKVIGSLNAAKMAKYSLVNDFGVT